MTSGKTKSCGCLQRERTSEASIKDYTGLRFGKLTVIDRVSEVGSPVKYRCLCDCGQYAEVLGRNLASGATKSCGCVRKETTRKLKLTHGQCSEKIYKCWCNMKTRCENPQHKEYNSYGGRGISVCEEWHDFNAFYKWALESGYAEGLTIERKNVDLGYSPGNCTWATRAEQARNRQNSVKITYGGKTMILQDWAAETGINAKTIQNRIKKGMKLEDVFSKTAPSAKG